MSRMCPLSTLVFISQIMELPAIRSTQPITQDISTLLCHNYNFGKKNEENSLILLWFQRDFESGYSDRIRFWLFKKKLRIRIRTPAMPVSCSVGMNRRLAEGGQISYDIRYYFYCMSFSHKINITERNMTYVMLAHNTSLQAQHFLNQG